MPRPIIKEKDNGYGRLRDVYTGSGLSFVDVGVLGGDEDERPDGLTNTLIAGVHEFGREDGSIPERSWNRAWVDENETLVRAWIQRLAKQVEQGKKTRAQALQQLGELIVAGMKGRIRKGIDPALDPSTIARKKSSTPLIDTSAFITSIAYKVGG